VHECLLGLRRGRSRLGVDPVIPKALDGLRAEVEIDGRPVRVLYRIAAAGSGPTSLLWNGRPLPFTRTTNPYRTPGAVVELAALREGARAGVDELVIDLE
jgi:1,2-beta-oligoglucan phosphorylase